MHCHYHQHHQQYDHPFHFQLMPGLQSFCVSTALGLAAIYLLQVLLVIILIIFIVIFIIVTIIVLIIISHLSPPGTLTEHHHLHNDD